MEHWLIIIVLTSGIAFPLSDFISETDCRAALKEMTFASGAYGGCMQIDDSKVNMREGPRVPLRKRNR